MEKSVQKFINAIKFSGFVVAVLWVVHLWTSGTGISLSRYGVFPRETDGLIGILTAPLIHGSWEHLISNSAPLFVTMTMISFFYKRVAIPSFIFIYLLTGGAVWMFGRSVYHIGASGVVYGLVAFIFWSGIFRRNIKSIILALIVIILYSGYLGGILPLQEGISWESHLMGGIVGIIVAYIFKGIIEKDETKEDPWADEVDEEGRYLLPRDTFIKTKQQRMMERDDDFLHLS